MGKQQKDIVNYALEHDPETRRVYGQHPKTRGSKDKKAVVAAFIAACCAAAAFMMAK